MADTVDAEAESAQKGAAGASSGPGSGSEQPLGHVLVVDDDERIRTLLSRYLVRGGYRATAARDAAHARRLVDALDFDILVVDVMMPGEDGLSFTKWIDGRTPVIMLTARSETDSRIEGLEAGADDYLTKPFEPKELKLRIDAVLRRANAAPTRKATVFRLGAFRFELERSALTRGDSQVHLTTGEAALLRSLAKRVNKAVERETLLNDFAAEQIDAAAGLRAIDVLVARLRQKLDEQAGAPAYIRTVRNVGYMLTPDGSTE